MTDSCQEGRADFLSFSQGTSEFVSGAASERDTPHDSEWTADTLGAAARRQKPRWKSSRRLLSCVNMLAVRISWITTISERAVLT